MATVSVENVAPARVGHIQQRALLRLLLYVTGETHRRLADYQATAGQIIAEQFGNLPAGEEPDGLALFRTVEGLGRTWDQWFVEWQTAFEEWQQIAASLAFGGLIILHRRYVQPGLTEATVNAGEVFSPQLQAVIDAANRRVYADGIPLSTRLWNLNYESRAEIQRIIYQGVADKQSAWNIAKQLQTYLGFGADCPRWTSTRLRLTKKEIASGDTRGLKSGDECKGQGVAYNALRLARNELVTIHALATDAIMARLPFVEEEQINLSPSHPVDDECDAVVTGGRDGRGIYPKGSTSLPIHIQCTCFKTAVLLPPDQFTAQLKDWTNGSSWPAMDDYAAMVGGDVSSPLDSTLMSVLLRWAFNPRPAYGQ